NMLDIKFIRENIEKVKQGVAAKNFDASLVDRVLELDERRRSLMGEVQTLQAKRNDVAEKMKNLPAGRQGQPEEERSGLIEEGKKVKEELQTKEPELEKVDEE